MPLHALSRFITSGLAVGFFTVAERRHAWPKIFLRALLVSLVGAGVACLLARAFSYVGLGGFAYAAPFVVVLSGAWDAFRQNKQLQVATASKGAGALGETNESEERFRNAFDYAAIGMALVSTEGRWLQVNRSLCRLLDYTEHELQTTDLLTVIHHDDVAHSRSGSTARNGAARNLTISPPPKENAWQITSCSAPSANARNAAITASRVRPC